MQRYLGKLWLIIALILGNSVILASKVLAQITPDNTLGSEKSIVTPNVNINGISSDLIEGGATRGSNLFHSFQEFSIPEGKGAYFANPAAIQNIFSRVTGNNPSQILGKLGVLGNANLFFINPNGIIFGNNASLDLNGSFLGSTANSITFPNGSKFSATNPQAPPLLTVNVQPKIGLVFGTSSGQIINQSTNNNVGIQVKPQQNLVLVGGQIDLTGGYLTAEQGKINLASVAHNSIINLNLNNPSWTLEAQTVNNWQNITLSQQSKISANNGGNIDIKSGNLTLTDSSIISTDTLNNQLGGNITINSSQLTIDKGAFISASGLSSGQAGNLTINTDNLTITGTGEIGTTLEKIFNNTFIPETRSNGLYTASFGSGKAGTLTINTNTLTAQTGAIISSSSFGALSLGGELNITANESIIVNNAGILTGTRGNSQEASAGNISINTGSLLIENGGTITTSTLNSGQGGNLEINANLITIKGESQGKYKLPFYQEKQTIPSSLLTASFGSGDAGDLTINTQELVMSNNGLITTLATVSGDGGDLRINSPNLIRITGKGGTENELGDKLKKIFHDNFTADDIRDGIFTATLGSGNAGDLSISTNQLILTNGSLISASTFGSGRGGNITIKSLELGKGNIELISAGLLTGTTGNQAAGNLSINTGNLSVTEGGLIATSTLGTGQGGALEINSKYLDLTGQSQNSYPLPIYTTSQPIPSSLLTASFGLGNAGNMLINTDQLNINNGALITTTTVTAGNGGNLAINATDSINLIGNINLQTKLESLLVNSLRSDDVRDGILSISLGSGSAGYLTISTPQLNLKEGALVATTTVGSGQGGNLTIKDNQTINISEAAILTGTLNTGNAGDLTINTASLIIDEGGGISTTTLGSGQGGDLTINATNLISLIGKNNVKFIPASNPYLGYGISILLTSTTNTGNAGNLTINLFNTGDLILDSTSQIQTTTIGAGQGGNLTINQADLVSLSGLTIGDSNGEPRTVVTGLLTTAYNTGNAGNLSLDTNQLIMDNGSAVVTGTLGSGSGGDLLINASEAVNLIGENDFKQRIEKIFLNQSQGDNVFNEGDLRDGIFTSSLSSGAAGNLIIATPQLTLEKGAFISSTAFGSGNGGNLTIQDNQIIKVSDAAILTGTTGSGNAGNLTINTHSLTLEEGGIITTATLGFGNGGDLTIDATELVKITGKENSDLQNIRLTNYSLIYGVSAFLTSTLSTGNAGDLTINLHDTGDLILETAAQIQTLTRGTGKGGTLTINNGNLVDLSGFILVSSDPLATGLFGTTYNTGNAGNLIIDTQKLVIRDGAFIGVASQDIKDTGNAGNIEITANSVELNQGKIIAETFSVDGGNITLNIRDFLLLRNGSKISTTAGTLEAGGNGGNIFINVPFIIAFPWENSDITANAFLGNGGRVEINAQALFGINYRPFLTSLSDITASSTLGLQGQVNINTLNVDPTQGLNSLPEEPVNTEINQGCQTGRPGTASFYNTGLGGYPLSPDDLFTADPTLGNWLDLTEIFASQDEDLMKISPNSVFNGKLLFYCQ